MVVREVQVVQIIEIIPPTPQSEEMASLILKFSFYLRLSVFTKLGAIKLNTIGAPVKI